MNKLGLNSHHDPTSLHWTDRVALKGNGEWLVYRLDDPHGEAVERLPLNQLCFHIFEAGSA